MLSTSYQSPKFSLTSVLPHSRSVRPPTVRQVVSTWTRCGGRLAPRRANERYTAEPTTLARLVCQAYHRHPGCTTCRPHCLNSLTPDAHRAGPLHPRLLRFAACQRKPDSCQGEMALTRKPAAPTYV